MLKLNYCNMNQQCISCFRETIKDRIFFYRFVGVIPINLEASKLLSKF